MDTRNKIRSLESFVVAAGTEPWTAATGVFDPLTVQLVNHLASLAQPDRKLLVVIDANAELPAGQGDEGQRNAALFSAGARAILLAALRFVDAVVIASSSVAKEAFLKSKLDIVVQEDPAADQLRSAEFVQHVLDRQLSATEKT